MIIFCPAGNFHTVRLCNDIHEFPHYLLIVVGRAAVYRKQTDVRGIYIHEVLQHFLPCRHKTLGYLGFTNKTQIRMGMLYAPTQISRILMIGKHVEYVCVGLAVLYPKISVTLFFRSTSLP